MERIVNLLLFIKDLQNFLSDFQQQHNFLKIYSPTFNIKIYSDLYESKFLNYYIMKSLDTEQLIIKPINKKISNRNDYILYDLINKKPIILNGSDINNFEYIRNFDLFISVVNNKNNKIINKAAIENRLQIINMLDKKIEYSNNNELDILYKEFLNTNKDNLDYFRENGLILINGCRLVDGIYDKTVYASSIVDIILGIHIPIDFDNNFYKNNKLNIEEKVNLITTFIANKIFQYKPNDKYKYFEIEYSCLLTSEKSDFYECLVTIDFIYNNLLNLLLFIDFLETIQYL
ncbi:MAG: hypothetical protein QXW35_05205 [Candidatus Aenigmatarchaeota archaeon]